MKHFADIYIMLFFFNVFTFLQMQVLQALKSESGRVHTFNNRPIQPLNDRRVRYRAATFGQNEKCRMSAAAAAAAANLRWSTTAGALAAAASILSRFFV